VILHLHHQRKRNVAQDGNSPKRPWCDRNTPHNQGLRASCEDELLALAPETSTTVLNLAGLWGGLRLPRNWIERVGPTKDALRQKVSFPAHWKYHSVSLM